MGKAVEEAHHHQDQCVRDHYRLIAHLVNDPAHNGGREEAGHRRHGEQQADHGGIGTVKQDQHIGSKGEEHLLPGTVEHLQHVILAVLFVEVEAAFAAVRLALAGNFR